MNSTGIVRNYFDKEAKRFDAIYESDKPTHQRVVDHLFRRVILERFKLICALIPMPGKWSVLDAGCGSGRYSRELMKLGAERLVGIDVSEEMIKLATHESEKANLQDRCEFIAAEFKHYETPERFDSVVATGYFDYLQDPISDLNKMVELCRGKIFATFPKRWEYRVPIRKARFFLARGFVRFYSRSEVLELFDRASVPASQVSLVDLGRDWVAIANVGQSREHEA